MFEKANANAQRREREQLLGTAERAVRELLSASDCIFTPEADSVLRRFLPVTATGIGTQQVKPPGYSFREFAWETTLFASLDHPAELSEGLAYLSLRSPQVIRFGESFFCVPDLPLFVVEFRAAAAMLTQLWPSAGDFIALVSVDVSAGLVIDNYSGYLREDFNPVEVVYEVATW